ncbi:hypothetical protein ACTG9Q_04210 [Actinokineospora sp. 24-640]
MTFPYDQARLDALVADVDARIANVERTAAEASRVGNRSPGLSEQDIAAIERHAASPRAPKALQDLVKRVKEGELSWSDIASGRALDDEGVQRAMAAGFGDLRQANDAIREGQDVEDVIDSRGGDDPDGGPSIMRPSW